MPKIRLSKLEKRQLKPIKINGRQYFKVNSSYDFDLRLLSVVEIRSIRRTLRKERALYDKLIKESKGKTLSKADKAIIDSVTEPRAPYYEFYARMSLKKAQQYRHAIARRHKYNSFEQASRLIHPTGGTLVNNYVSAIIASARYAGVSDELTDLIVGWFRSRFYDGYVLNAVIKNGDIITTPHDYAEYLKTGNLPSVSEMMSDIYFSFKQLYEALVNLGMPDYAKLLNEDLDEDEANARDDTDSNF